MWRRFDSDSRDVAIRQNHTWWWPFPPCPPPPLCHKLIYLSFVVVRFPGWGLTFCVRVEPLTEVAGGAQRRHPCVALSVFSSSQPMTMEAVCWGELKTSSAAQIHALNRPQRNCFFRHCCSQKLRSEFSFRCWTIFFKLLFWKDTSFTLCSWKALSPLNGGTVERSCNSRITCRAGYVHLPSGVSNCFGDVASTITNTLRSCWSGLVVSKKPHVRF